MFTTYIQLLFYISLCNISLYSHAIPIDLTDTNIYLLPVNPNITNLMVLHYDCEKQHNSRQFNFLNVKPFTEAPSNIQHVKVRARVYVRAKAKRVKAFKSEAYAKKERNICFQGSRKYRCVDRTVWNHKKLPLPITLDPLECKDLTRHLNGTINKILNNFNYNRTFTLLEDHYFQEKLEQYQTPFTVYNFNTMYTDTFAYKPAVISLVYDPKTNLFHNCPAHNKFKVNLISWRVSVSEVELTYDDTEKLMVIDGHGLPCYFADGFCKPTIKSPFTLFWLSDNFCLIFTLEDFVGRMTKINDRYSIETDSFIHSSLPNKTDTSSGIKGTSFPYIHPPHSQNPHNPSLSRFELFPHTQFLCGKSEPLYTTQSSDLFVTYQEGFNMHTGQPNPRSIINEYFSGKIVLDSTTKHFVFPALNVSNNIATIDYDAHFNTKIDY